MSANKDKPMPSLRSDEEAEAFVDTADLSEYDLSAFNPMRLEYVTQAGAERRMENWFKARYDLPCGDEERAVLDAFRQLDIDQQDQFIAQMFEQVALSKSKGNKMDYDFQAFSELVKQASHPYKCEVAFKQDDERMPASGKPKKPTYTLEIQLSDEAGIGFFGIRQGGIREERFSEKEARSFIHNFRKEVRQRGHALTPWRFPS